MIGSQVITETGLVLGWVKRINFNSRDRQLSSFTIAPVPISRLPDFITGAYELSGDEIAHSEPNRLIVFEGAEKRVSISAIGIVERLGLIKLLPYELEDSVDGYIMPYTRPSDDEGDTGSFSAIRPRRPNPNPSNLSAEVQE